MISSFARPSPTTAGSRDEPPTSGIRPTRVSGSPSIASSAATRRSQASASSSAPPMQAPCTWHTVGLAISSHRFQVSRISRRKARRFSGAWERPTRSEKSIPEENIGPSPRITTQRTSGSLAAALSATPSAWTSSPFNALRFSGRSRTTWRTGPRSSVSTMGMSRSLLG